MCSSLLSPQCVRSTERRRGILIRRLAAPLDASIYGEHAYQAIVPRFSPNGKWVRIFSGHIDVSHWLADGQRIVITGTGKGRSFVRYAIASRKSYSYILQFAVCLGQLYGCLVYFITAYLEGDNFSTSPHYYWAYYIGANSSWVVIPLLIAIRCWKKISVAFQARKRKTQ